MSNLPIKKHLDHMSRTKTYYFCIICMVSILPCVGDNDVLFKPTLNHFHSASHHLCEEEKIIIKEAFKIDKKSETIVKLTVQKKIILKRKRKKAERKEKQARQQY